MKIVKVRLFDTNQIVEAIINELVWSIILIKVSARESYNILRSIIDLEEHSGNEIMASFKFNV